MSNNYYEQNSADSIQFATLAEDVKFTTIKNLLGKFYVTILTPEESTSSVSTTKKNSVQTSNYVDLAIPAYMLIQFMEPTTRYMKDVTIDGTKALQSASSGTYPYLSFTKKEYTIKKGTKFLIGFIDGEIYLPKIQIIGVYITIDD